MSILAVIIIFLTVHLQNHCSGFDYCSVDCTSGPGSHTMCKYRAGGGDSCGNFKGGLGVDDKKAILTLHNELRQKVSVGGLKGQPSASNMRKLEWDEETAMIAQRWADQCQEFGHDDCRVTKSGGRAGQNIAVRRGHDPSTNTSVDRITRMMQAWFDEVEDLAATNVDSFNPSNFMEVGHYTQFVWADTMYIGCGYNSDNKATFSYLLVCNYLPGGNLVMKPTYQRGKPCSACPPDTHCSRDYPGLCTGDKTDVGDGDVPTLNGNLHVYVSHLLLLSAIVILNLSSYLYNL